MFADTAYCVKLNYGKWLFFKIVHFIFIVPSWIFCEALHQALEDFLRSVNGNKCDWHLFTSISDEADEWASG